MVLTAAEPDNSVILIPSYPTRSNPSAMRIAIFLDLRIGGRGEHRGLRYIKSLT